MAPPGPSQPGQSQLQPQQPGGMAMRPGYPPMQPAYTQQMGPVKLDPRFLYQERERRILAKMAYRVNELMQIIPTLNGTPRMRAEIELKQLKVWAPLSARAPVLTRVRSS